MWQVLVEFPFLWYSKLFLFDFFPVVVFARICWPVSRALLRRFRAPLPGLFPDLSTKARIQIRLLKSVSIVRRWDYRIQKAKLLHWRWCVVRTLLFLSVFCDLCTHTRTQIHSTSIKRWGKKLKIHSGTNIINIWRNCRQQNNNQRYCCCVPLLFVCLFVLCPRKWWV